MEIIKPFYKKMVPAEELPYLLETLISLLLDGNGKVAVKDYLQKIKLVAPNSYGRKISEYRCYVVVGALEKAGILEQKERGKYCYAASERLAPHNLGTHYTHSKRGGNLLEPGRVKKCIGRVPVFRCETNQYVDVQSGLFHFKLSQN